MPTLGSILRNTAIAALACVKTADAGAQDVAAQLREMQRAIEALQTDLADARKESEALRKEVQQLRDQLTAGRTEDDELLAAKVDELEQTRVESGSQYHVRLSGLALLQAALTQGEVDSADLPGVARPAVPGIAGRSFTAGARQSYLRIEVFGPRLGGARTRGETTMDFFGGFPITTEGFTSGFARLRTTTVAFDWDATRIVAGHEGPFFSPSSPTSLLQSAYPPLWAAGNMWSWIPQAHVEHRLTIGASALIVQGGVLDPLTGEIPASEYDRVPTAGERSRRPAAAARLAWQHGNEARRATLGSGTYYSRQDWGFGRGVNAWAATADWSVPIVTWLAVSGEVYAGHAIAGLGASAAPSVTFSGPRESPFSAALPFRSAGGWSQIKIAPTGVLEFNAVVGTDRSAPANLAWLLRNAFIDPGTIRRNTSGFINGIYTLRSNLLFSIEYRRLRTTTFGGATHTAGHLSVGGGLGF